MILLTTAALASAESIQKDNLRISVNGKLSPHRLPREGIAPVAVKVGGRIATTNGSQPPQLRKLVIQINSHGHIETAGLPLCKATAIRTASNGRALAACGPALVGEGKFLGTITLPGSAPYPLEGKLLVFNGREHGHPVLLGHVFSPKPFSTSFVIVFEIRSGQRGTYGTTFTANLKQALGTQRNLTGIDMTLQRRYSYRGTRRSYLSSGCPTPKGFTKAVFPLVRMSFNFAGGKTLASILSSTCEARG